MEMRDVFDKDGRFTGKTVPKHAQLEKGEYFLHAIVILRMEDGGYLLQQRSLKARWYAGAWDVTGGGVSAGETSAQAAAREAYEELGLDPFPGQSALSSAAADGMGGRYRPDYRYLPGPGETAPSGRAAQPPGSERLENRAL